MDVGYDSVAELDMKAANLQVCLFIAISRLALMFMSIP